jgi:hypothetical protein
VVAVEGVQFRVPVAGHVGGHDLESVAGVGPYISVVLAIDSQPPTRWTLPSITPLAAPERALPGMSPSRPQVRVPGSNMNIAFDSSPSITPPKV